MDSMELMSSEHFHVLLHSDNSHGLIFNKLDQTVATINHDDAKELSNLRANGRVYGIVGKFLNKYLVLIKNRSFIGKLFEPSSKTEHDIYVITQVQVVDLTHVPVKESNVVISSELNTVKYDASSENNNLNREESTTFSNPDASSSDMADFSSLPITISSSSYTSQQSRNGAWNPFRIANSLKPRIPTQILRSTFGDSQPVDVASKTTNSSTSGATSQSNAPVDDSDKRLVDEMVKLFNHSNSFYYSPTLDLTNRFSRKIPVKTKGKDAMWKTADERFFWNKNMLKDFIELSINDDDANYFIDVILHGFVAIYNHRVSIDVTSRSDLEDCSFATITNSTSSNLYCDSNSSSVAQIVTHKSLLDDKKNSKSNSYQLALVSRRSVFQAGTRYLRRGCDPKGNCANFVETEQIFRYNQYFTSVIILRGSIPLFWYQTGFNYRPPPVLTKTEEANHEAFKKHFDNLFQNYDTDQIIAVDCTEQTGREKNLHETYRLHIEKLQQNYPKIKLIEFDFHKYCKGRQISDIQVEKHLKLCGLTDKLINSVKYYWNDGDVVCNQTGVFRVNCLDCSDRTNVVQRAIALQILDTQLAKLGILAPDTCPKDNEFRRAMQPMWASNGNVLSTQYCGTRALFSGDKMLAGYLQDTYSSASRYYISKFRDAYRQAAIDAMLGVDSEDPELRAASQKADNPNDQYELINLDPVLLRRSGGALLKDVSSRVSNRLARLKGKFYVKPFGFVENIGMSGRTDVGGTIEETDFDSRVEDLTKMSIDWPATECTEDTIIEPDSIFTRMSNTDDSFQDDDFGHLMLSLDIAKLQTLKEDKKTQNSEASEEQPQTPEKIDLREVCGPKSKCLDRNDSTSSTTST